jgi:hypothetical protein
LWVTKTSKMGFIIFPLIRFHLMVAIKFGGNQIHFNHHPTGPSKFDQG